MSNLSDTQNRVKENIYKNQQWINNNGMTNLQARTLMTIRNNIMRFTSHWIG